MSAEKVIDSPTVSTARTHRVARGEAAPDFLADPEDEEEPVVGAGSQDQDDQDELG